MPASTAIFLPEPRLIQGIILLVASGLSVLVTAVLGPSLPAMQAHFNDVPRADYLVPLTMTAPMLMMAGLSVFAGAAADRVGRKALLVGATALYAVVGTAPLYLQSLGAIIISRFLLGATEAVLMTVSTTMLGDYFDGARRERLMSLQTTVASTSALLLNNLGGVIGEHGWRTPYALFAGSLVLSPLMAVYLWEPRSRATMTAAQCADCERIFQPRLLGFTCALAVLLGIVFLIVPVHLGYLFGAIGMHSLAWIGFAYGINSLGVICGTLLFGWVLAARLKVIRQLALGALITGLGFVLMKNCKGYAALTAAGFVNGLGAGILLPTMVTWNMRELPISRRGLGTGAFQSGLFLGMFLSPILIVAIEKHLGAQRAHAVGLVGTMLIALAAVPLIWSCMQTRGDKL